MSTSGLPARLLGAGQAEDLQGDRARGRVDDELGAGRGLGVGRAAPRRRARRATPRTAGCPWRRARCGPRWPAGRGCRRRRCGRARGGGRRSRGRRSRCRELRCSWELLGSGGWIDRSVYCRVDANRQICLLINPMAPQRRPRPDPRHRVPALLRPRHPGGRRRPDHRRVRAWPRRPSTSTSRPRTTSSSPTSTRSTAIWSGQLHDAAAAAGPDPADQLVGLFDALGTACRRDGYRGCAFINAAAETVPGTPSTTAPSRTRPRCSTGSPASPRTPGARPARPGPHR